MVAPPIQWALAWPQTPSPTGVQVIAVTEDGMPCLDKPESEDGLGKRSHGVFDGSVFLIGNPVQSGAVLDPARVVEGVADGLAVGSRYLGPVVVTFGTSGLTNPETVGWLANWSGGVVVHADTDDKGSRCAVRLVRAINRQVGVVHAVAYHPTAGKDSAEAAQVEGFFELLSDWPEYARQLVELDALPRAEAARLASIVMQEAPTT